jgi:hypothetical protein
MSMRHSNTMKAILRISRFRVVENFIVIWLDSTISGSNEDTQNSIRQLRHIDFIISGSLCQQLISLINDTSQIESIYVICGHKSKHEIWANGHRKIKGVFNEIKLICDILKKDDICIHNY